MDYNLLIRRCKDNIQDSLEIIHKHRENIERLEKEIRQLQKDKDNEKANDLGFDS